jgi:hypothetical protein
MAFVRYLAAHATPYRVPDSTAFRCGSTGSRRPVDVEQIVGEFRAELAEHIRLAKRFLERRRGRFALLTGV